jgi:hypothetical protein
MASTTLQRTSAELLDAARRLRDHAHQYDDALSPEIQGAARALGWILGQWSQAPMTGRVRLISEIAEEWDQATLHAEGILTGDPTRRAYARGVEDVLWWALGHDAPAWMRTTRAA